jgi:SAM-dependent methyltransferase
VNLREAFARFVPRVTEPAFLEELSRASGLPAREVEVLVGTAAREAVHMLGLLAKYRLSGTRVLEVGSGTGLLGAFLRSQGVDVYLIEPGGIGFETHAKLFRHLTERLSVEAERRFECPVEALDVSTVGQFGLIFSNNVLEHVEDVERALARMSALLLPDGVMVHSCPNYRVPYEPHYGVPLVPVVPKVTGWLLPSSVSKDDCWRSLNFITAGTVTRAAKRLGCDVRFEKGVLFDAFGRLGTDAAFRERHRALGRVYDVLQPTRIMSLLKLVPYDLATPMVFAWRHSMKRWV